MKSRFFTLSTLVLATASFVTAGSFTYTALVDGTSTWNRPVENGPDAPVDLSLTTLNAGYHSQSVIVGSDGAYTFDSTYTGSFWDNYIFLYQDSFDPNSPLTNALIGNDDGIGGPGNSGFVYNLLAGVTYYLVTTGYSDTDLGSAINTITGAGSVGEAPEPGTLLITVAGLGILAMRKKLIAAV